MILENAGFVPRDQPSFMLAQNVDTQCAETASYPNGDFALAAALNAVDVTSCNTQIMRENVSIARSPGVLIAKMSSILAMRTATRIWTASRAKAICVGQAA